MNGNDGIDLLAKTMSDFDRIMVEENEQRQRMDAADQRQAAEEEAIMSDLEFADRQVLMRVRRGETTHRDYLYLVGRLELNLNDLEN